MDIQALSLEAGIAIGDLNKLLANGRQVVERLLEPEVFLRKNVASFSYCLRNEFFQ